MKKSGIGNLFTGLSRQVLLWFLLVSLAPLYLVSAISYKTARDSLRDAALDSLAGQVKERTAFIENWFSYRFIDLESQATADNNVRFLGALRDAFKASGKGLGEFVNSYQWNIIVDEWQEDLRLFMDLYGYHDIFLIDVEGNILFTFAQESDLGTNLFNGPVAGTRFAAASQRTLETGEMGFSDLEYYAPSNNAVAGFFTSIILDKAGEKLGVLVFQIGPQQIEYAMRKTADEAGSVLAYVIGHSKGLDGVSLRTELDSGGPVDEGTLGYLNQRIDTQQTRLWLREHDPDGTKETAMKEHGFIYPGPNGNSVLGIQKDVLVANVDWGVIAEIPERVAFAPANYLKNLVFGLVTATGLLVAIITMLLTRRIVSPILEMSRALVRVSEGDLQQQLDTGASHELGSLTRGFNSMILNLRESELETQAQRWLQEGNSQLKDKIQGDLALADLARNAIGFLCHYLKARIGAFYVVKGRKIKLVGSFAFRARKGFHNEFELGEGMVGQAALEQQTLVLSEVPDDYLAIGSGLGETPPRVINVIPLIWNDKVVAMLEFGALAPFGDLHHRLIEMVAPAIALAVQTSLSRDRTQELLQQTQDQAEELQAREEELRDSNTTLGDQARELKRSEEILRDNQAQLEERNEQLQVQQEELRVSNEELEDKARELKASRDMVEDKNQSLEQSRMELERKAEELTVSSRYKSEFLANMSHELRTPLNSLLILAKLLADNKDGNLTGKQVEFSRTIFESGGDLLTLINDILDLSKIEAGKMEVHVEPVHLDDFVAQLEHKFRPLAMNKGIGFEVRTSQAPDQWRSDGQKLGQVIKNLLSNAVKFTDQGQVTLRIGPAAANIQLRTPGLTPETTLAIEVIDSGIGIPEEKCKTIFEAFQQADGTTSRKYGGTGLGLSISRELAKLLRGEIRIVSTLGKGSTFTLYIPRELVVTAPNKALETPVTSPLSGKPVEATGNVEPIPVEGSVEEPGAAPASAPSSSAAPTIPAPASSEIPDDRHELKPVDRSILIIEDDTRFATILADTARERGFKVLVAEDGETGLHFADYYLPSGIVLDIGLPGMDGRQVMEQLKDNSKTRHIPVHFMSVNDSTLDAMKQGAMGFLTKPVSMADMEQAFGRIENIIDRPVKRLLLVEDDPAQLKSLRELIGNGDVETMTAETGAEARDLLSKGEFDCIVLDLGLPDMDGLELLENLHTRNKLRQIPVVVFTCRELEPKERAALDQYAQSIIIKDVRSPERLLDDTTLFLHRVESTLPEERRRMIRMLHDREAVFEGRKALLVDDDMRNIFALSAALQEKNMQVLVAKNGIEALEKMESDPDTAIVLMDIMMPKMDGYEATHKIRQQKRFADLPIIALTAKAMKGDRAKCIEAGASDYLAKPVDTEKLMSMMRVWLYR